MRSVETFLSQNSHWHLSAPELCHESFNIGMEVNHEPSHSLTLTQQKPAVTSDSGVADLNRLSPDSVHDPGPRGLVECPRYGPTTCVCISTAQSLVIAQMMEGREPELNWKVTVQPAQSETAWCCSRSGRANTEKQG